MPVQPVPIDSGTAPKDSSLSDKQPSRRPSAWWLPSVTGAAGHDDDGSAPKARIPSGTRLSLRSPLRADTPASFQLYAPPAKRDPNATSSECPSRPPEGAAFSARGDRSGQTQFTSPRASRIALSVPG